MKIRLGNRIAILFLSILIISAIATIGSVLLATNSSVKAQAQAKLKVGKNVFEQLLYERGNQLLNAATVLVADFGFKDAISSNDQATIESALINNRARINADLMFLITLDGSIISSDSEHQTNKHLFKELLLSAQISNGTSGILFINDGIFQFSMLPVKAPVILGWAVIATKIDQDFALQLKEITTLDVIFKAENEKNQSSIISTIKNDSEDSNTSKNNIIAINEILENRNEQYLTLPVTLSESKFYNINAYLNTSLNESYLLFYQLKIQVIVIACITLILSIISAFIIARKITKPITNFVKITKEISSGNYREEITQEYKSYEIENLRKHFNKMQKEISLREEELTFLAYNDSLTGVANRSYIIKQLSDSILNNPKKELAIVRVCIDKFKETNDTFGYDIGDEVLICFAQVLISYTYRTHYVARISAAEFIIIFNDINENTILNKLINLQTILQHPLTVNR